MTTFCENLIAQAAKNRRRILLPESTDGRVLQAAARAAAFADCLLIGDPCAAIQQAKNGGFVLPKNIRFLPPMGQSPDAKKIVRQLAKLRADKGMTTAAAKQYLQNPLVWATMMMKNGDADGMVAGAATNSADVLRPVLQILRPAAGVRRVSSLFFMCFPQGAKIFADCALNLSPTAEQLADIAVAAAKTARQFGIKPVVSLLSYATGDGGIGDGVEKIRQATILAQKKLGDITVMGPVQYDAAINPDIAKRKAPQWKKAGHSTVLIFPDLAAGNIAYKAVQHAANIVAVGPVLQGLSMPVNDLSRGASVDDIVHSIALTAIQAV